MEKKYQISLKKKQNLILIQGMYAAENLVLADTSLKICNVTTQINIESEIPNSISIFCMFRLCVQPERGQSAEGSATTDEITRKKDAHCNR
jgi:hypothetical protein